MTSKKRVQSSSNIEELFRLENSGIVDRISASGNAATTALASRRRRNVGRRSPRSLLPGDCLGEVSSDGCIDLGLRLIHRRPRGAPVAAKPLAIACPMPAVKPCNQRRLSGKIDFHDANLQYFIESIGYRVQTRATAIGGGSISFSLEKRDNIKSGAPRRRFSSNNWK